jgi:hypothetical protein
MKVKCLAGRIQKFAVILKTGLLEFCLFFESRLPIYMAFRVTRLSQFGFGISLDFLEALIFRVFFVEIFEHKLPVFSHALYNFNRTKS